MDLVAVDIGNSRITWAQFTNGQLGDIWHHPTADAQAAAKSIASAAHDRPVALCSVVPKALSIITDYLQSKNLQIVPIATDKQQLVTGIYATMGADRVANAVGAWKLYGRQSALSVIDLGTATTLTTISQTGQFCGGFITLGLGATLSALHQGAAQLPEINTADLISLGQKLAHDTPQAMAAGTVLGHLGLLKQWLELSDAEIGSSAKKILTGGWSKVLTSYTDLFDVVDPDLILKGIYFMAEAAMDPMDPY